MTTVTVYVPDVGDDQRDAARALLLAAEELGHSAHTVAWLGGAFVVPADVAERAGLPGEPVDGPQVSDAAEPHSTTAATAEDDAAAAAAAAAADEQAAEATETTPAPAPTTRTRKSTTTEESA